MIKMNAVKVKHNSPALLMFFDNFFIIILLTYNFLTHKNVKFYKIFKILAKNFSCKAFLKLVRYISGKIVLKI
jgi:hypothetical protein